MDEDKRRALEAAGFASGDAEDFLGTGDEGRTSEYPREGGGEVGDESLKSCPCCGGEATVIEPDAYGCLDCHLLCDTPERWNRRTPPHATARMLVAVAATAAQSSGPIVDAMLTADLVSRAVAEWGADAILRAAEDDR